MFAEIDASGYAIIIGAVFLGITQIVGMVLAYYRERDKVERDKVVAAKVEEVKAEATKAAVKVVEVKADLRAVATRQDQKLTSIQEVGNANHALLNSGHEAQLKLGAELSRWKADHEGSEENLIAADKAEKLYQDHVAKQAKVDTDRAIATAAVAPLIKKLDAIADTGDENKAAIDDVLGHNLKTTAHALRKVAEYTKKTEDIETADMAEKAYQKHIEKQ